MLADRYNELMTLRREALRRYRANEFSTIAGPPARAYFPRIGPAMTTVNAAARIGPYAVADFPPVWGFCEAAIRRLNRAIRILEIGPGAGILAAELRRSHGSLISEYFGLERDASFSGAYTPLTDLRDIRGPIDLVIASEVAEHMSADQWYSSIVSTLPKLMSADGELVMSVPNPTAPAGIARDFTHMQAYPWYDLYAIMRLEFPAVEIHRAFYVWSAQRLLTLVPRIALCSLIELDWCDTLICTTSRLPRAV